jgi:hypothetical protein
MVKIVTVILLLFSFPSWADVNSDVNDCLKSNTSGGKAACVQAAIAKESQNQIQKLFTLYSNFASNQLNPGAGGAPQGGGAIMPPAPATITAPKPVTPPPQAPIAPPTAPPPPTAQPPGSVPFTQFK